MASMSAVRRSKGSTSLACYLAMTGVSEIPCRCRYPKPEPTYGQSLSKENSNGYSMAANPSDNAACCLDSDSLGERLRHRILGVCFLSAHDLLRDCQRTPTKDDQGVRKALH